MMFFGSGIFVVVVVVVGAVVHPAVGDGCGGGSIRFECPDTDGSRNRRCPPGTYTVGEETQCTPCPPGYRCPSTTHADVFKCAAGTFSLGNRTTCTSCPPGFACPDPASHVRVRCENGFYSQGNLSSCVACPAGFNCEKNFGPMAGGATSLDLCAPGYVAQAPIRIDLVWLDLAREQPPSSSRLNQSLGPIV